MINYLYTNKKCYKVHEINARRFGTKAELRSNTEEICNKKFVLIANDYLFNSQDCINNIFKELESNDFEAYILKFNSGNKLETIEDKLFFTKSKDVVGIVYRDISFVNNVDKNKIKILEINGVSFCNNNDDIYKHIFKTKAETLGNIFGLLNEVTIDRGLIVQRGNWINNKLDILEKIKKFEQEKIVVRSSSKSEDNFKLSNAGAFDSFLNINKSNSEEVTKAINNVFKTYKNDNYHEQVLIQNQVINSKISGVLTSRTIGKNSPYYVVSYDDQTGQTDTVTSGSTNNIKTLFVLRNSKFNDLKIDNNIKKLILEIKNLEEILNFEYLDVEFIIDNMNNIHIVQVRPLVGNYNNKLDKNIYDMVEQAKALFNQKNVLNDGILKGSKSIFGIMPDANPAELIGIKPKPLAFSLYQRLITDDIVTQQRYEFGYRDVRPVNHMVKYCGTPFIDVRSSFNSFTPQNLDENISEKLIDAYLNRLEKNQNLHDKVEFEVVMSTWYPGIEKFISQNYSLDFTELEIEKIVNSEKIIFLNALNRLDSDLNDVNSYDKFFKKIVNSNLDNLNKAWRLLEICYFYGCKPFAHLARTAFIAVSYLKGLIAEGIISEDDYHQYLNSIESVSTIFEKDSYQVKIGKISKESYYEKYGHLRPGTYDILSQAYFEDPQKYLDPLIQQSSMSQEKILNLKNEQKNNISNILNENGFKLTFNEFDHYIRNAINGREYGKFTYTKFLSYALNFLIEWGKEVDLTRDDLAYLEFKDIERLITGTINLNQLISLIFNRKHEYLITESIELPTLIKEESDFYCFYKQEGQPNFITNISVSAEYEVIKIDTNVGEINLKDKIILIEGADPGYDWLFGHEISGLVTCYGGANSHMAIRCAELNIPAAIGVGDLIFNNLNKTLSIKLDPVNKILRNI
ncbi:PEP/pyruvate-binding domain-containing protein [Acinetobacter pittii]|uniref:PEP/pyruvate-binding domain-containing protein n=1 Tax=Acinetobacter pittii TaxID=48296 RepID=UPI00249E0B62|nr:PEP/pyruvate-binding domain-containing protein [Acinetobacter pittii]WHA53418.1 L-glutamine kinase [Acinetobacter pittii]